MREYATSLSTQSITAHFPNGDTFVWPATHPNFSEVRDAIKRNAPAADLRALMDVVNRLKETLTPLTQTAGDVVVTREGVTYKGKIIRLSVTEKILAFIAEGFDATAYINFLEKLFKNPRKSAVDSLYDFLEVNKIAITEDGDFLVFKKVRSNYLDIHSGTMDNSVGNTLRVEAWEVEENRDQTCAKGLHVCARHYLPHFGGDNTSSRVVICKVNPADVVAVPRDYNNAKMRVCGYEVIGELNDFQKAEIFDNALLVRRGDHSEDIAWGDNWNSGDEESEQEEHEDDPNEISSDDDLDYGDDEPEDEDDENEDDDNGDDADDDTSGEEYDPTETDPPTAPSTVEPPVAEETPPAKPARNWTSFLKKW